MSGAAIESGEGERASNGAVAEPAIESLRAENERLAGELAEVRALYRAAQRSLLERDEQIHNFTVRRHPAMREADVKRGWRAVGHGIVDILEPSPLWRYGVRRLPGRWRLRKLLGL